MKAVIVPAVTPTEEQEQVAFASWLDWTRVVWCHVPNGGDRHAAVAGKLRAAGTKAGVPDCLIFDRPACDCALGGSGVLVRHEPSCHHLARGVAVELKRRAAKGRAKGVLSSHQAMWHQLLAERGWLVFVCYGADEAIAAMTSLGIGKRGKP